MHSAYSHFLFITIQHYLIKYKRTKQIFANNIFIPLLQFIKFMIYFNKLIGILYQSLREKKVVYNYDVRSKLALQELMNNI